MGNNESKGLTLTEKIIKNHIIDGEMIKGTEIGLRIDQTLNIEWKYLVPISMVNLILMV